MVSDSSVMQRGAIKRPILGEGCGDDSRGFLGAFAWSDALLCPPFGSDMMLVERLCVCVEVKTTCY